MSWSQYGASITDLSGASLGFSVSFNSTGTRVAIGSPGTNTNEGLVQVYNYSGGVWTQIGLDLTGENANDFFGYSVSLSDDGTILAVGAYGNNSGRGKIYTYQYTGGAWVFYGTPFAGVSNGDNFGFSVSLSADKTRLAIGAPAASSGQGSVYVYSYSSDWLSLGAPLNGSGSGNFGHSVGLSSDGSRLVVGEPQGTGGNGLVKIYAYSGSWSQVGSTISGPSSLSLFGESVGISADGTLVVIGAPNANSNDGLVRVYLESGGSWSLYGSSIAGASASGEKLGTTVSISADGTTIVGYAENSAAGKVNGYKYTTDWTLFDTISGSAGDYFGIGNDISNDGNYFAFGASGAISGQGEVQTYQYVGGGGGGGDPYITTVEGVRYKLPIMDGTIRFYQGEVDGKTLTINAQLRTMENSEMVAENIRSFNDLKGKIPAYKLREIERSIFITENLAFFEKFYINYAGTELVVDVWDSKFKIEAYKGEKLASSFVDGNKLTGKYTGIYKDYKSSTLKLKIGSCASLYLSVYPAKLLKNGIYIEAPEMEKGNGVLVNTLSTKDMTLSSFTDLSPVARKNTRPRVKEEWFLDKDGYRTKKINLAA
jgi:hypothetical protein